MDLDNIKLKELKCLYFGCLDQKGHYVFTPNRSKLDSKMYWEISKHDGTLTPPKNKDQGDALLHYFNNFTVLAWWDYTIDSRPGSNSMIIAHGQHSYNEVIYIALEYFEPILKRQPCSINLIT